MSQNTLKERVARLEEHRKETEKQVERCMKIFEDLHKRLGVVNDEQGNTRVAILELKKIVEKNGENLAALIKKQVTAPLSGRDKATIYAALITGVGGIIVALISLL